MKRNLSRRDFLKGTVAGAIGMAAAGVMAGCQTSATETTGAPKETEEISIPEIPAVFAAGTYVSTQQTGFATVDVVCTFSENALTEVTYEVKQTSNADYFKVFDGAMKEFCGRIVKAGKAQDVDGVTGATLCENAIRKGVNECTAQAMGLSLTTEISEINPQDESYTAYTTDCAAVFQPIEIGTMKLKNRIIKSAGSSPWARGKGNVGPVAVELYGRMAEGGVSLIIGGFGFSATSLKATMDDAINSVKDLVTRVHAAGSYLGTQMSLGGPGGNPKVNDFTIDELKEYIADTATAATQAKAAGIDCVEIKCATCDGLNAFLTRRQNKREDEYGPQSLENRTRFIVEMIRAIKDACGQDYPVVILMNGMEENDTALGQNELYLTIEETKEIAKIFEAAGADMIQVRVGTPGQEITCWAPDVNHGAYKANGMTGFGHQFDYTKHFEGMLDGSHSGYAAFIPMAKAIKEVVSIPVGCAGAMDLRLAPDLINNAVANGDIDLVFMNRPLNVDPELPNKMKEGRRDDILPCLHCMHCHDNISTGRKTPSRCRVSASWQCAYTKDMPEGFEPLPAEVKKNVMVIGGGPAGMEAARVAAERGHTVSLYEATDKLGGLMLFAEGVKGPHEHIDHYVQYMTRQLEKDGVTVNYMQTVTADTVKAAAPDAVVVAVGGGREKKLESAKAIPVMDLEAAFGNRNLGQNVVILGVGAQAVDMALYLLAQGKSVQMVHGDAATAFDKEQSGWHQGLIRGHLSGKGVKIWNNASVNGLSDAGLSITTDAGLEKVIPCDAVVEAYDMVPNMALAQELEKAGFEVYAVGDCNAPGNIKTAVSTANLAARKL